MKPEDICCPVCRVQITRQEMELEITTKTITLLVVDGKLAHKICMEHPLSRILLKRAN